MKSSKAVCQSCGSPILKDRDQGTERDGAFSRLYCRNCYRTGSFTDPEMTVEKMSGIVLQKMTEMKFPRFLAKLLADRVHTLKRWEAVKA